MNEVLGMWFIVKENGSHRLSLFNFLIMVASYRPLLPQAENVIFYFVTYVFGFQKNTFVLKWGKLQCGNMQIPSVCSSYQLLYDKLS